MSGSEGPFTPADQFCSSSGDQTMTHSLHRCGKHQEKDYVWLLYHVKGVNDQNLKQRYQKSLEIAEAAGAVNWGDVKSGPVVTLSPEEIRTRINPAFGALFLL
jgi:hypothetical protein